MKDAKLVKTGIIGSAILALCCFTPVLVVLLSIVGLSAALGWLDYVLLPALAVFLGLTIYAVWRRQNQLKNSRMTATNRHGRSSEPTGILNERSIS